MTRPWAAMRGAARSVPIKAQAVPTCRPASSAGPESTPEACSMSAVSDPPVAAA